jgi:hypothetical protein
MFSTNTSQVSTAANYIEDVFSTYLYTGNGSTQTITNGIDLAGKGGLVWVKQRSNTGTLMSHYLMDTARGTSAGYISSNTTNGENPYDVISAFNSNGFAYKPPVNDTGYTYASWTFRKQPKFFDVVTYTGNGGVSKVVNHSLNSSIGMLIIKRTDSSGNWSVFARESGGNYSYWNSSGTGTGQGLNGTGAATGTNYSGFNAYLTSTYFDASQIDGSNFINSPGATYVAYLFASNAGGFGLTGNDNVISCGSFTSSAGGLATVNLGYEPQWVIVKGSNGVTNWQIMDTMRGFVVGAANANSKYLNANSSSAELDTPPYGLTNTGFDFNGAPNITYIYIAIRRGPMKVPTLGTSVFNALSRTGTAATATVSTTVLPDLVMSQARSGLYNVYYDRLRGAGNTLSSTSGTGTDAESYVTDGISAFNNSSYTVGNDASQNRINWNTYTYANWLFSRAPGFFDEVCSSGFVDGTPLNHNLGVTPELIIVKARNSTSSWMGAINDSGNIRNLSINTTSGGYLPSLVYSTYFNATTINPTGILNGAGGFSKGSGVNVVAYLFATCAGVSKVGSYTGTGATQTISCGFTGGARFVLIKRTDSTGDWYVWDTARGMVSGTDPSLLLNSTAAEVNANSIYTTGVGFQIVSTAADINASGGTYIFLAIA